nr:MAG TPA: hypothetical protein [Caudoviricetes sp.]
MATIKNNFFSKACLQSRLFSLLFSLRLVTFTKSGSPHPTA